MASGGKIEIEKFNGQSFELWKLKMEDLLVDKDQWIAVDPGTKPTAMSDEDWKKLDRKAKSTIRLCVSDSVLLNVSGEATAKNLWEKLGTLYQSKSLVNKLFLQKKLYNLRMKD
jgi:gag-polypeptide of LTR copia-type